MIKMKKFFMDIRRKMIVTPLSIFLLYDLLFPSILALFN